MGGLYRERTRKGKKMVVANVYCVLSICQTPFKTLLIYLIFVTDNKQMLLFYISETSMERRFHNLSVTRKMLSRALIPAFWVLSLTTIYANHNITEWTSLEEREY